MRCSLNCRFWPAAGRCSPRCSKRARKSIRGSALAERMLPTYPQAAARRAEEMAQLEKTFEASGLATCVIEAVRRAHEELASVVPGRSPETGGSTISA